MKIVIVGGVAGGASAGSFVVAARRETANAGPGVAVVCARGDAHNRACGHRRQRRHSQFQNPNPKVKATIGRIVFIPGNLER